MMENPFLVFVCVVIAGMVGFSVALFGAALASMVGWLDWADWPIAVIGFPALWVFGWWAVTGK